MSINKRTGDVILWAEDDANVPDAESMNAAYQRITDQGIRFTQWGGADMGKGRLDLPEILAGRHRGVTATVVDGGGPDDVSTTWDLSNGLSVTISGERCSQIFIRRGRQFAGDKSVFVMQCEQAETEDGDEAYTISTRFPKSLPMSDALKVLGLAARGALETGQKLAAAKGITDDEALAAMGFD